LPARSIDVNAAGGANRYGDAVSAQPLGKGVQAVWRTGSELCSNPCGMGKIDGMEGDEVDLGAGAASQPSQGVCIRGRVIEPVEEDVLVGDRAAHPFGVVLHGCKELRQGVAPGNGHELFA